MDDFYFWYKKHQFYIVQWANNRSYPVVGHQYGTCCTSLKPGAETRHLADTYCLELEQHARDWHARGGYSDLTCTEYLLKLGIVSSNRLSP